MGVSSTECGRCLESVREALISMAGSEFRSRQVCWADGCGAKGTKSVVPGTKVAV